MRLRASQAAACAALAAALAAAAPAAPTAPGAAPPAAHDRGAAIEELLRSARLWQSLGHPDEERGVLYKLLAVQPDEARALFLLGELELRTGRPQEAQRALALLQAGTQGAASSAQRRALLADLQAMEAVYTRDKTRLSELRLVVRGGNRARALALARALFPSGRPPGDLANEFAGLLASTPSGWQAMRAHLSQRIAADSSSNDRLSLDELLAQHPDTRAQALRGFEDLSRARDIEPARVADAWRAALRTLPDDDAGLAQRRRFLARFARDAEVRADVARIERARVQALAAQAELAERERLARDPGVLARQAAERALDAGRFDEADAQLQRSLALRAGDPETIGTLGLLRFRQGRYEEATARFEQAQAAEAQSRPDLAARWRDLAAASRYWGGLQQARRLRDAGQLDAALRELEEVRPLQPGQNEAEHLLADLLAQQGRYDDAQGLYEALLRADARDARAWRGRVTLELRRDRIDAALDLAEGLPARAGVAAEDALDAGELRDAIARAPGHPDATLRRLERGVGLLPGEAWLRYDLARAYIDLGLPALARQSMQEGQDLAPDSPAMRYAAALVDAALDREDAALARLDAVPAQQRTEGMSALAQRMRFERDLRLARAARVADRAGEDAHWRAQALADSGGDPARLLRVARADLSADDAAAARALLEPLRDPERALDIDDRRALARLLIDADEAHAALEQVDLLALQASSSSVVTMQIGSGAAPAAATAEADTDAQAQVLLLRARAHLALRDAPAARADWNELDALLPVDEVARRIDAVEEMDRDRDTAHAWMERLRSRHPDDPRVLLEAGIQARRDEQYAQAVGQLRAAAAAPSAAPLPLLAAPGSPAGDGTAAAGRDDWMDALGRYATGNGAPSAGTETRAQQELAGIEARRQPRIEAAWLTYSRSADDGISTIRGTEIPLVVSWPGGYDGHWFAQVDSVHVGAGTLPSPLAASAQFGAIQALPPLPTGLVAPIDEAEQGYSLAGGWRSDNRRVDLGIVGLGFASHSIVGGWRESRTWNDTDVSAEITRRVQASSLLAYAGVTDPATGAIWGGVTDTALTVRAGRDLADRWSVSGSLSAGVVDGRDVVANPNQELRLALDRDWIRRSDFRLSAGPTLSIWHYASNESFYTLGQGGYYSPQRYVALGLPVEAEGRRGLWSYDVRVVPSRSWTNEQDTPYYPTDGALQALAGDLIHAGGPGGGPSASVWADVEYRAAPHWTIGAWLDIDRSAYYAPTRVMLYLRYWFKPQEGLVPFPPRPVLPISLY